MFAEGVNPLRIGVSPDSGSRGHSSGISRSLQTLFSLLAPAKVFLRTEGRSPAGLRYWEECEHVQIVGGGF